MQTLVITLIAQDKPGIVDRLSKVIRDNSGNWQASSFSHMAGHFAGFLEVSVKDDNALTLLQQLNDMADIEIKVISGSPKTSVEQKDIHLTVTGNDKPGIVQDITKVIHSHEVNILKFESSCKPAPNWGGNLFVANLTLACPVDFESEQLSSALEDIANDLVVDIDIQ